MGFIYLFIIIILVIDLVNNLCSIARFGMKEFIEIKVLQARADVSMIWSIRYYLLVHKVIVTTKHNDNE